MSQTFKILIVTDAWLPQVNGVVRTYQNLERELTALGHDVKIIGPSDFSNVMPLPSYPEIKLVLAPYVPLRKMIRNFHPDYIHIATEGPLGWAARRYCLGNGIRFSTIYHTQFPQYVAARASKHIGQLYEPVKKLAMSTIRRFHAPSSCLFTATQSLEDELKAEGFATPQCRLSRGVNQGLFNAEKGDLFKDLPQPVALYVGRIAIEKNLEEFLAMDWIGSKVLVGEGPARDYLQQKYPDAHFVGKKEGDELANHYRSADVFVFPSRTDTFGMVIIEALASGLPIAAYNVIGPKDIVTSPDLGCLDEDLGKAAIQALRYGNRELRAKHVADNYTWPAVAQQFLSGLRMVSPSHEVPRA